MHQRDRGRFDAFIIEARKQVCFANGMRVLVPGPAISNRLVWRLKLNSGHLADICNRQPERYGHEIEFVMCPLQDWFDAAQFATLSIGTFALPIGTTQF